MHRRRARSSTALVLLALSACAPSAARHVEAGRYDEAICAADRSADGTLVARAIARDLGPALQVHAVTRAELEASIGDAGRRVAEQVLILRFVKRVTLPAGVTEHAEIKLAGRGVSAVPDSSGLSSGDGVGPTRALWAALTGEEVPPIGTITHHAGAGDKLRAALSSPGGLLAGTAELLMLGAVPVMELSGAVPAPQTTTAAPTDADFLRRAPAAEALHRSFENAKGTIRVFARPAADDVKLRLIWRFGARGPEGPCEIRIVTEIPLPGEGTIEERVNRRFGDHEERLIELGP